MPPAQTGYYRLLPALSGLLLCLSVNGQSVNASLNEDYYHWIDRYEIASGRLSPELFTTLKPYKRAWIVAYVDSLYKQGVFKSKSDEYNYQYFLNDSWEWSRAETSNNPRPLWKYIYRKKADFANVDVPDFDFHISPVLHFAGGIDSKSDVNPWINLRGFEMRGMVDKRVGFYAFVGENQAVLPTYVNDEKNRTLAIPHEGFWKGFKTNGVDFFQARGYIDFNISKHIYMQFGHDKMFVGNGMRSLIWSDYGPPQLYMRANVKVWKLNYLFQLNRMVADVNGNTTGLTGGKYPEKFAAFHHVSFNIGRKLNLGLFESVVFSPSDTTVDGSTFEWNYLNPVIFYRAVEQQYGSSDNVILGLDFKLNLVRNVSFYGQMVIDEFLLSEVRDGNGWWGNKVAFQLGGKYINAFGVSNLDLQLETNMVRPYTYSHNTLYGSYSTYKQAIAHPLGANFSELAGTIRYQPLGRLSLSTRLFYAKAGKDGTDENWGGDILKDNTTREMDEGNKTGQGIATNIFVADFTASWMLAHNLFIDLKQVIRNSDSDSPLYVKNTSLTSVGLRLNVAQRNYDF
jgi:hypothetical protein